MRRRLYFILPNVSSAKRVFEELLLARIEERHMHFLAKEGTNLKDLPEADLLQKYDVVHGVEVGIIIGGATGALVGLGVSYFGELGLAFGGALTLVLAILGAIFGVWASGMIATDVPNTQLQEFEGAIKKGRVLMMVDVPKKDIDTVTKMVKEHHPEADVRGVERGLPAFP